MARNQGFGVKHVLVGPARGSILQAVTHEQKRCELCPQFRGGRSYDPRGIPIRIAAAGIRSFVIKFVSVKARCGPILRVTAQEQERCIFDSPPGRWHAHLRFTRNHFADGGGWVKYVFAQPRSGPILRIVRLGGRRYPSPLIIGTTTATIHAETRCEFSGLRPKVSRPAKRLHPARSDTRAATM